MLEFNKIEAVRFGDFKAEPEAVNAETKLRLQALKFETEQQVEEARTALSNCFGAKAADVKEFMIRNMYPNDLQELQIYLTQGPQGLATANKAVETQLQKALEKGADKNAEA